MVNYKFYWPIIFLVLVVSCNTNDVPKDIQKEFDYSPFQLSAFNKRVIGFINENNTINNTKEYYALFVNTQSCSACVQGAFNSIKSFIKQVSIPTYIYINDSSLIDVTLTANKYVTFKYYPLELYKKKNILHGRIYIYAKNNDLFKAIEVNANTIDSLDSVVKETYISHY
jgi:hypothetical protein